MKIAYVRVVKRKIKIRNKRKIISQIQFNILPEFKQLIDIKRLKKCYK